MEDQYKEKFFHPAYFEKLRTLQSLVPTPDAVLDCYKEFDGKLKRPDLLGKTVEVTKYQLPDIWQRVYQMSEKIGIDMPKLYLYENFYYGMEAKGAKNPRIEISVKTVTDLSEKEFNFLLAREFCRIKYGMVKWSAVGNQVVNMLKTSKFIPGTDIMNKSFYITYANWSRTANYSADCFAYDIIDDIKASVYAILTLILNNTTLAHKINIRAYVHQMKDIYLLDDLVSRYTENDEKVPYGPMRIRTLLAYATSKTNE